ncbi:IclR family transcriptional regulator [Lacrimispora indolis]|uniref:IclR family transcriptional regulator n=1 Tax=Lacrimispora indolis TaxID=69825 RepID=UPI00045E667C|nr:IclR family transcriptional regulator [Lacrimispora indolis]
MGVKSAERVLEIFELLKEYPDGLTSKEIGEALGYAASSTFNLVKTLLDQGYLLENENKRYTLGAKLIQLGAYASSYLDLNKIAAPVLKRLMETLKETVFMAVLSDEDIVYVAKVDNYRSISTNARLGGRKPIYCTGLGKAFLTFIPDDQREALIERLKFVPITEHTITKKEELYDQIKTFKKLGYAVDNEEIEVGLWCAAAPIFNRNGEMEAAVSVSGPTERMRGNKEMIVNLLLQSTKEISEKLGYIRK